MKTTAGKTVLITGACGGIGSALLEEFVSKQSKKIYAAGINMENLEKLRQKHPNIVVPVKLDVTNIQDVLACKEQCDDTEMTKNLDVAKSRHKKLPRKSVMA